MSASSNAREEIASLQKALLDANLLLMIERQQRQKDNIQFHDEIDNLHSQLDSSPIDSLNREISRLHEQIDSFMDQTLEHNKKLADMSAENELLKVELQEARNALSLMEQHLGVPKVSA